MNPLKEYTDKQLREELDRRGYFVDELFCIQDVEETINEMEIDVGFMTFVGKQTVLEKAYRQAKVTEEMLYAIQDILEKEYT